MGIEPTNAGATIRCVSHFATTAMGMVEGDGFEPPNPEGTDLQSAAFSHFATPPNTNKTGHQKQDVRKDKICRFDGGSGRNRTADTRIFSPLLYRLSYRAIKCDLTNEVGQRFS